jgi:hypothetical protein
MIHQVQPWVRAWFSDIVQSLCRRHPILRVGVGKTTTTDNIYLIKYMEKNPTHYVLQTYCGKKLNLIVKIIDV